jgi:hypothetical protein
LTDGNQWNEGVEEPPPLDEIRVNMQSMHPSEHIERRSQQLGRGGEVRATSKSTPKTSLFRKQWPDLDLTAAHHERP